MDNHIPIIKYAMKMELDGHNFFKEKGQLFKNPTTRELFLTLADIEMDHYRFLDHQLKSYEDNKTFDLNEDLINRDESSIFKAREKSEHIDTTLIESDVPDVTILRMAYLIERDFKEFYTEVAEKTKDEDAKRLFELLAKWEKGHEDLFKEEYDKKIQEYMNLPWGG